MTEQKRIYCPECLEFIGEFEPGSVIGCPHCQHKNLLIPPQNGAPQGQFSLDSLDYDRLISISFELFKVIDQRPRVGELKNMAGYTGVYKKVFGRKIDIHKRAKKHNWIFRCIQKIFGKKISVNEVGKFLYDSKNMVSVWVLENCQVHAVPIMVKITPGYEVE
jgi:hypothetical protein